MKFRCTYRLSKKIGCGWLIIMESEDLEKIMAKAEELSDTCWISVERI